MTSNTPEPSPFAQRRLLSSRAIVVLAVVAGWWAYGMVRGRDPRGIFGIFRQDTFVLYIVVTAIVIVIGSVIGVDDRVVRRRRKFKAVAILGSLGLMLLLFELLAMLGKVDYRLVFSTDRTTSEGYSPRFRIDRKLIALRYAHDSYQGRVAGDLVDRLNIDTPRRYDVDVRWDQNGFRNASDMSHSEIVMMGDSFLEAALVPFGQIASSVLARELGVSVMNLGHGGYGPQQEWVALKRFGLPARPKIVVWVFYEGNDLVNYHQYRTVMADWDGWLSRQQGYLARSFLPNALEALVRATRPNHSDRSMAIRRAGILQPPSQLAGQTMYFGYQCRPLNKADPLALLGLAKILGQARQACDAQGAKLLLVFAPNKWRVHRSSIIPGKGSELSGWTTNDLPEQLGRIARIKKVALLDATMALRKTAKSGGVVYHLDDAHWNAAGNRSVAIAIADIVRRGGWTDNP